jgi:SmpA / OmlA family
MHVGAGVFVLATPDFGASGGVALFVLVAWATIIPLVLLGIIRGMRLLGNESPKLRRRGYLLLVMGALIPLSCCLLPSQVVRLVYGNYPLGSYPDQRIHQGMSRIEVQAILGSPHERFRGEDEESWYYWIDSFGAHYFGVIFGPEGRVTSTHGN